MRKRSALLLALGWLAPLVAVAKKPPAPAPNKPAQVQAPKEVLQVRVFVGVPDATAETPLNDPGLVGVFTLYPPHRGHGAADRAVTLDLDATATVRQLIAEKKTTKFPVTVVTVQVGDEGKARS